MTIPSFLAKPISAGLFWGLIGGLSLIAITFLSNKGLIQIIPYPFILIAASLSIKYTNPSNKIFSRSFIAGLLTFILMSVILCVYVLAFVNASFELHFKGILWRLGLIAGIGIVCSFIISFIAKPVNKVSHTTLD